MIIDIIHYPSEYLDIIYLAGRNCYGMESISAFCTHDEKANFIRKLIKNNHLSVVEHINICIYIKNVSRSFLAQLTRHRLASFSVKSQHFTFHNDFKYKWLESNIMEAEYTELMNKIQDFYRLACEKGMPKYIAREVLPNSALTNIFMTSNVREFRHIISLRITNNNTPEIQDFAKQLLLKLIKYMPELFLDLKWRFIKYYD